MQALRINESKTPHRLGFSTMSALEVFDAGTIFPAPSGVSAHRIGP